MFIFYFHASIPCQQKPRIFCEDGVNLLEFFYGDGMVSNCPGHRDARNAGTEHFAGKVDVYPVHMLAVSPAPGPEGAATVLQPGEEQGMVLLIESIVLNQEAGSAAADGWFAVLCHGCAPFCDLPQRKNAAVTMSQRHTHKCRQPYSLFQVTSCEETSCCT